MEILSGNLQDELAIDVVRQLMERHLALDLLLVPPLPEVAVRVVGSGTKHSANAHILAEIIHSDAALTEYVLHIAASAAKRPAMPIASLQHAIAWLGLDEVANLAFTLALQGKMLHVKGQHRSARRLWRHSLASALWARQLAHSLGRETGLCYLCGLLHDIGKVVSLGLVQTLAEGAGQHLMQEDYHRLIETFNRDVGRRVIAAWSLPKPVPRIIAGWENYGSAGDVRWESNVVNLAHKLADFTLAESAMLTREALVADPAYRDLQLDAREAEPLFDSAAPINAELDHYLSR